MRWEYVIAVTGALAILLLARAQAEAQAGVRLTGQIDQNFSTDVLRVGDQSFETISWGSRYMSDLSGFIWDPRFLTFSAGGGFGDQRTDFSQGESRTLTLEPYRLNLSLFPEAPHSFLVRASRSTSDSTFPGDSFVDTTTDIQRFTWNYRGSPLLPETTLGFNRQAIETHQLETFSEETRTASSIRLRKSLDRAEPTFNYVAELVEFSGSPGTGPTEGVRHRAQYDDRIRFGDKGLLLPLLEYQNEPTLQSGSGNLTLTTPLSPTLDSSASMRYAFLESGDVFTHATSGTGQLTKRFTPDLVLTTAANGALAAGDGTPAWSGGGSMGLSAAAFGHLRSVSDYALLVAGGDLPPTFTHRGHLGVESTILPRHTLGADYFLVVTDVSQGQPSLLSHSGTASLVSHLIRHTTLSATYAMDLQEGPGERERHSVEFAAEVIPHPSLSARGSGEFFTEESTGGGRTPLDETGFLAEAGVVLRALGWLELSLSGRQGVKEATREDRSGQFLLQGLTATASATLGTLLFNGEGFYERDQDLQQNRQGIRGSLSYRFRVWSLSADFEVSELTTQGVDIGRQRFAIRLFRPLDFTVY